MLDDEPGPGLPGSLRLVLRSVRNHIREAAASADGELKRDCDGDTDRNTEAGVLPRTGDRLPQDELISILGSGGIERVYRAHDWRLRPDVAVEVLTPEAAAKPEMRVRFEREARAMAGRDNLGPRLLSGEELTG